MSASSSPFGRTTNTPAAMVKPPLPGMERVVLRLLLLLALILELAAPWLPWLADQIPGQNPPRSVTTTTGAPKLPSPTIPPHRQLANLLRALSHPPALWVTTGIAVCGYGLMAVELAFTAGQIVRQRHQWNGLQSTYLRIRPLRPQSRKGAQAEASPHDLWRSLHALDAHLCQSAGSWVALTLTALPEEPVALGAVVVTQESGSNHQKAGVKALRLGSRHWLKAAQSSIVASSASSQRPALARVLESLLLGQDAGLVVDRPPDPLENLPAGAVVLWEALTLTRPAHLPIRTSGDADVDLVGALAAALRTPPGVLVAEIQLVPIPRRDLLSDTPWRVCARRRLIDLQKRSVFGMSEEARTIAAKIESETFDVTLRLVAVATDTASESLARATLREVRAAFGQYQQRAGLGVQRFALTPFGSGRVVKTSTSNRMLWNTLLITILGLIAISTTALAGRAVLGALGILTIAIPLACWSALRGAQLIRSTRVLVPQLRSPQLPFPKRLLVPFPLWRSPIILSSGEAAGLWHLPSTRLQSLISWLPNRYLPAQPHVFIPPGESDRLILGYARTRDGGEQPVGPSLRDLRQVLHITAGMGAGKSRALANIAEQLIQRLQSGMVLLDGKGDDAGCLAATVRSYIPRDQEQRLMLIDLLDAEWPIGLNPFYGIDTRKAGGATQALGIVLALLSRLDPELMQRSMGMIQFIQMGTILVVEGEEAPTFASLKQCLEDASYRAELLQHCTNLEVINFWKVIYPETSDQQRNSLNALLRRFDNLLVDETTRYLLTQPIPTIDFLQAIEEGAIVLAPLPHRTLGSMAEFIGMLLMQAIMRAAFQRTGSDQTRSTMPLIIDELQVFIGNGDSKDIRDAVTQLRGFGIAGIYAHQTLFQLGDLRDEMLTNSASRLILRTQEPDASAYARQYPTTDLTPADISGQHPLEHQYCILASHTAPAEVFSLRPRLWPQALAVEVAPAEGPEWQTVLPADSDDLDRQILFLVYSPIDVAHVSAQLAMMPEDEWRLLSARWDRIRAYQRQHILTHPGCLSDRLERQRWLSRLWICTPRVLAAAVYQRQRWAIDPTETPPPVRPRHGSSKVRDEAAPANTAVVPGIAPDAPPLPPAIDEGKTVGEALSARGQRRSADDSLAPGYGDLE